MSSVIAKTRAPSSRLADRALIVVEALVGIAVVSAIVGKTYGAAPTFVFLVCGSAAAFTAYAMIRMFGALSDRTLDVSERIEDEDREALEHEKLLLLQGIKELEADFAIGKVAPEDYDHLRRTAEHRALAIIERIKRADAKYLAEAERLVEKRLGRIAAVGRIAASEGAAPLEETSVWLSEDLEARTRRRAFGPMFDNRPAVMTASDAGVVCQGCQTANDGDAKFCVGCGRPRQEAA